MRERRETFSVAGVGCWCPGNYALDHYRLNGHTPECTQARSAWRANYERLSQIEQQRRVDAEIGRQVREAARVGGDG